MVRQRIEQVVRRVDALKKAEFLAGGAFDERELGRTGFEIGDLGLRMERPGQVLGGACPVPPVPR